MLNIIKNPLKTKEITCKIFSFGLILLLLGCSLSKETDLTSATPDALKETMAKVQDFQFRLEKLREKKFKKDVAVKVQSEEDFRQYVRKSIDESMPEKVAQAYQTALIKLGLLPTDYNLRTGIEDLYVSQAGAYYEPTTKTFYVLKTKLPPLVMNPMFIHELQHALQDQYFDLDTLMRKSVANSNDDQARAFRYLMEGEATYVMTIYSLRNQGFTSPIMLHRAIMLYRYTNRKDYITTQKLALALMGEGAADQKKSLEIMEKTPLYLFWSILAPYFHGADAVHQIVKTDQWDGIDKLFANPPVSTEQLMHPEKLIPPRDDPIDCPTPEFNNSWTVAYENTLGEFGFWVLFTQFETESSSPLEAAAGWDGDKYFLLKDENDHTGLGLITVWDDAAEAQESFKAYGEVLNKKHPNWTTAEEKDSLSWSQTTAQGSFQTLLILKNKLWVALEDFPQSQIAQIKTTVLSQLEKE